MIPSPSYYEKLRRQYEKLAEYQQGGKNQYGPLVAEFSDREGNVIKPKRKKRMRKPVGAGLSGGRRRSSSRSHSRSRSKQTGRTRRAGSRMRSGSTLSGGRRKSVGRPRSHRTRSEKQTRGATLAGGRRKSVPRSRRTRHYYSDGSLSGGSPGLELEEESDLMHPKYEMLTGGARRSRSVPRRSSSQMVRRRSTRSPKEIKSSGVMRRRRSRKPSSRGGCLDCEK